jgi:iron complex outermembrane receptor protein
MNRLACGLLVAIVIQPAAAAGQAAGLVAQDLKRLTIEELAEVDITSASRLTESLATTPAAVTIISDEEIRRSGAITLADAMRLAGVLDVARIHGNAWAVSARGFTITTANKLLVMIDGRTIYSPLFSGTFWDAQDVFVADIDRIEVVRGPGGATWGANAVNGVINVITKPAAATRGTFVNLIGGSVDRFVGSVRHGGRLGAAGSYRVYGKYRDRGAQVFEDGRGAGDTLQFGQGGFRLESSLAGASSWFVQGDVYGGLEGLFSNDDAEVAGGNVMGRWARRFSDATEFQAQVYYDRTYRRVPGQFEEKRNTVDVEAIQRARYGERHQVVFGGTLRVTDGRDIGTAGFRFVPVAKTDTLFGAFVQDEIALRPERVYLRLGSKFERNDFTGLEVQPTARVRVSMGDRQTAWAAVSRAVRLPTRFDTALQFVNPATGAVTLTGSEDFETERVIAWEGGYRIRPHARLALDAAAFVNGYDDLRSVELPAHPGEPAVLRNLQNATTSGVELLAAVQPHDRWRVQTSYAYLHSEFTVDPGSRDPFRGANEANDPSHVFALRSFVDLPHGVQIDAIARAVGERPAPVVDRYGELDVRLGWTPKAGLDLSLVGQNLLHARHTELAGLNAPRYAIRRGVYLRSTWRF